VKYLVYWKRFIVENNIYKKEKDLENAKKGVVEFKEKLSTKIRRQEKLDLTEKKDFRKKELLGRYIAKILYGWDNKKFEEEYSRKLERNWQKWKLVSLEDKPWRKVISELKTVDSIYFHFNFSFIFLILDLELKIIVISCMTVTKCYTMWHCVTYLIIVTVTWSHVIEKNIKNPKQWYHIVYLPHVNLIDNIRGLALPSSFSSMFFGWSMIYDPFPHPHSSAHLISSTSDHCTLILPTIQICYWTLFSTLSCSSTILYGFPKSFNIICTSAHLLSHTLEISAKYSSSLLFQLLLFLIT